ncbi:hypothetical protein LguiA_021108 [Lonicera macranthoides]
MSYNQRRGGYREQRWKEKPNNDGFSGSPAMEGISAAAAETVTNRLNIPSITGNSTYYYDSAPGIQFRSAGTANYFPVHGQNATWKPRSYKEEEIGKAYFDHRAVQERVMPSITGNSTYYYDSAPGIQFRSAGTANYFPVHGQNATWKPRSYKEEEIGKACFDHRAVQERVNGAQKASVGKSSVASSNFSGGNMFENFKVDNSTYSVAQIRATFYPKFENDKSDQEVRTRMIEMVSKGLATMEVSLKHSGFLFMYAGHQGGAYAKNSYGNIYTAVGVFVLGQTFCDAWGTQASKKQQEFNDFLELNHMCISMELVTAVLGDHGQRPLEDYVVVTAITELGKGKPKFYSTPDIIAFCRKWRLPTNDVWLFSTRKSVTSFFAAYDALCEEGTATTVCKALDEVADVSVPGSKDHIKVQGEILEGLVARIVNHESSKHMEQVLKDYPPPPLEGGMLILLDGLDLGPSLREICAANRSDEKQQIKALLRSVGTSFCPNYLDWFGNEASGVHSRHADWSVVTKFLQAHPADFSTAKFQEMILLMSEKGFPAAFKCFHNFHKIDSVSSDNLHFKMVVHVHGDLAFQRYHKEMRYKPGLWPLYQGFFIDINLFKASKEKAFEISRNSYDIPEHVKDTNMTSGKDGLADEDADLMVKLKFLTYKLRTFLIRNGLSILFQEGPFAYKAYYLRQIKIWNTSAAKQGQLIRMLDEWAIHILKKYGRRQLSPSIYLSEAEPFLEQYAKRSPENQALIGSAGTLVRAEDFLANVEGDRDEEGVLEIENGVASSSPIPSVKGAIPKTEGLIVFFPGIPGSGKSALCQEIVSTAGLGDDRPVHSLMSDHIKGKYWQKVADECRRRPCSIMLADKNAPNEEVWRQIEDLCRTTKASAVPVVPDSEGTETNPFSIDALAIFIFRVFHRVNHPGNLELASPNAGYVMLMFYHIYEVKSRKAFETELIERFGSLVKIPLLKSDRDPLPDSIKSILVEGINLYGLHTNKHGSLDSTKGTYARDWARWEKQLRDTLFANSKYLYSIQVPFQIVVTQVVEQLRSVAKGECKIPSTEKRKFGTIVFAAVSLPVTEIQGLLDNLAEKNPTIESFVKDKNIKNSLNQAHVTLADKRSHGVAALANYASFINHKVPTDITALLFSDELAAFEAQLSSAGGEKITSKNEWPHVTLWTGEGLGAEEANTLPQLLSEGRATRIEINPPITVTGVLKFY